MKSSTQQKKKKQEPSLVPAVHKYTDNKEYLLILMSIGSESLLPLVSRYLVLLSFSTTRHSSILLIFPIGFCNYSSSLCQCIEVLVNTTGN